MAGVCTQSQDNLVKRCKMGWRVYDKRSSLQLSFLKGISLARGEKLRPLLADSITAQTYFSSAHRLARNHTGIINLKLEMVFRWKLRVTTRVQKNRNPIISRLPQGRGNCGFTS